MSNLAQNEQHLRPRNRKPRRKSNARWLVATLLLVILGGAAMLFVNLVAKEQKANQIREPYAWGPVLLVDLNAGGLADNFLELNNELVDIKEKGFQTIVLPIIQDSEDVFIGETVLRAPKNWESINPKFGTEGQLQDLIDAAHKNDQKILFTLSTGWISKSNPWYLGNETSFYDQNRVDGFLKRLGLDAQLLETLALPNPIKFDETAYYKTVGRWVKKYNIDGIFVDSPFAIRKDLDRKTLEKIKSEFSASRNFITLSSNLDTPSASRSPYSATFSDFVKEVFDPVSADFNADNFAINLHKKLLLKNGPIPLNPIWIATPDYLNHEPSSSQNFDSAIAFAYLSPGVPVVSSNSLSDPGVSKQIYELNARLREALRSRNENLKYKAEFFVAQTDGVVAYRYGSEKEHYVVVLNTTGEKLDSEKIEVPSAMTGKYSNLLTDEIVDVSESWSLSLEPNSVKVFTSR